jgi:ParB-like chromosome segregation protein Spo0J
MKLPDQLETIQIDALIPYARNSRTHSDGQVAQIASSIKEFGFTNPVLIDGGGGSLPDMAECSLHASWA